MTFDLLCKGCGYRIKDAKDSDYRLVEDQLRFPYCPTCGTIMYHATHGANGDYNHISDSLAIHPDDIPEHRERFPGVEVLPDGRPKFTSPRQQEKYAKRSADCYKKPQITKSQLGRVRIA